VNLETVGTGFAVIRHPLAPATLLSTQSSPTFIEAT